MHKTTITCSKSLLCAVIWLAAVLTNPAIAQADAVATVNGVAIDQATLDFYLESRIQRPADQATQQERDAVLQELKDIYLLTTQPKADELAATDRVRAQIELSYRGAIAQAVAADFMARNPATDAEILAAYDEQIGSSPSRQFKARHILVETQAKASDLIAQLDDGADFEELARVNSTGPSAPSGGDLGWFAPNQMVEPFANAVSALEDGEYTAEPVQTEFGWHVILREESRVNEPPPLESVRDRIRQVLEQQHFQSYVESLRDAAESQ